MLYQVGNALQSLNKITGWKEFLYITKGLILLELPKLHGGGMISTEFGEEEEKKPIPNYTNREHENIQFNSRKV